MMLLLRRFLCAALLGITAAETGSSPARSCTIAVTDDGSRLIVANAESGSVSIVDAVSLTTIAEVRIGAAAQTVVTRGDEAFVACADGRVAILDPGALRIR